MTSFQHLLANVINGTPNPKHHTANGRYGHRMTTRELAAMPKELSLERIMERCEERGIDDPHDIIADCLDARHLEDKSTGMNVRVRGEFAWRILEKAIPSKQAIKHSGDAENPVAFTFSKDDEDL